MYQVNNFLKRFNKTSPMFLNHIFKQTGHPNTNPRTSFLKLNQLLRKTNHGQKELSYLTPNVKYLEQPTKFFESN